MRCPALATRLSDTNVFAFQASDYLGPEDLLKSEVEKSQRKLQVVVDTLNFFKQVFKDRRENLPTYFKENQEVREWDFQTSLVFVRLEGFLRRLHMVEVSVLMHPRLPAPDGSKQSRVQKVNRKMANATWWPTLHWLEECTVRFKYLDLSFGLIIM